MAALLTSTFLPSFPGAQWGFVSISISRNPWSHAVGPLGNISTVIIRNVTVSAPFPAPNFDAFHIWGNQSEDARVDNVIYDGVSIGGQPLLSSQVGAVVGCRE